MKILSIGNITIPEKSCLNRFLDCCFKLFTLSTHDRMKTEKKCKRLYVVYFDQLWGAACTQELVETFFQPFFNLFAHFKAFSKYTTLVKCNIYNIEKLVIATLP